jgi:hypothetical protein
VKPTFSWHEKSGDAEWVKVVRGKGVKCPATCEAQERMTVIEKKKNKVINILQLSLIHFFLYYLQSEFTTLPLTPLPQKFSKRKKVLQKGYSSSPKRLNIGKFRVMLDLNQEC